MISVNTSMKSRLIYFLTGCLFLTGCYYDAGELLYPEGQSCTGVPASFSTDVFPLIQSRCALTGCHAAGSTNTGGSLTSYSEISSKASLIRNAISSGLMPVGSSLSTAEIKSILCWVDSGAPNN